MGDELALYTVIRNRHDWDKPDIYRAQSEAQVRWHIREANQMYQWSTVYLGNVNVSEQFEADGNYELEEDMNKFLDDDPLALLKATPLGDDPLALLTRLLSLVRFAVDNAHNFTEHDPDGVKGVWMDMAREAIEAIDKKGRK